MFVKIDLMKHFLFLLLPFLMGCPPRDRIVSPSVVKKVNKAQIDDSDYEMLTFVDVSPSKNVVMNDRPITLEELCQSLFTAHAFSGHIVLSSPQKIDSQYYALVYQEIKDCHFKFLQLQAADLYDKTYDSLSLKTQKTLQEMFKLQLIEAEV